ncbi:acyltransferase [Rhizocola hellebori]|uniref:Acyltransferase n=1 Tax=Rhizocola hellebori TaxID=1392758 RepID=A0A8J3QH56_9ACTN|nr:acyltransferase [Rhizocola hellebori]GIH09338.1 acyltransferase [Rhizocola hellebori]
MTITQSAPVTQANQVALQPKVARLDALTGLRFIAAFMVFVFHAALLFVFADINASLFLMDIAGTAGHVGVSFFFILSGFVLTWSMKSGDTAPKFWRRRFFKIAPNHVVTFAIALVCLGLAGTLDGVPQTLANLFLIQSWFPDLSYVGSVNDVTWSISVEALFYLSFPLVFWLVTKIKAGALWPTAIVIAALSVLMPVVSYNFLPSEPQMAWGPASFTQVWFVYMFPVVRLLEFTLGILLARIVLNGKWFKLPVVVAALLAIGGYILSLNVPFLYGYVAATVVPLALLIPSVASIDIAGKRSILNSRLAVWLGEISFAFFLLHHLVLRFGYLALGPTQTQFGGVSGPPLSVAGGITFFIAAFAVTIVLAWALFTFVERPIMRRFARARS